MQKSNAGDLERSELSSSAKLLESAGIGRGGDWKAREVSVEESALRSFNARPWRPKTRGAADADADSLTPARMVRTQTPVAAAVG